MAEVLKNTESTKEVSFGNLGYLANNYNFEPNAAI
jgi:hypothetical protein